MICLTCVVSHKPYIQNCLAAYSAVTGVIMGLSYKR